MSSVSAKRFLIQDLGPVPADILQKCRNSELHTVQDLLDEGEFGCYVIGLEESDIISLNEMLAEHDFESLN